MTGDPSTVAKSPRGRRQAIRLVALGILMAGVAATWHWRGALDPATTAAAIGRYPAAPLIYIAIHIAASLLFVPRTLLAVLAGLLFGMAAGVCWAAAGSVAGAVAGFLVARYLNSELFYLDRNRRVRAVLDRVERGGWRAVALLRLIPVMPHSLGNYGLGLTRMRLAPYAFGSLVGQLPMTIAYVDFGAAGERAMLSGADWVAPAAIGAAMLALSLLIPALTRRRAG
ncbi:MAG: TVP38/TMEM64 family protein [Stellaceae bacterium]